MCMDETIRKMGELEGKILDMVGMETAAGLAPVNARELGEAVDMLKDLAEAKYYCSIVTAMEAEGNGGSMGYNNRRYASGRFAPAGRGTMGYDGGMGYEGGSYGYDGQMNGQMGYQGDSGRQGGSNYGMGYQRYQQARMGYTQSKTAPNKRAMDDAANEHLQDVMDSVRDIWRDADAGQRVQMKNALVGFVNELK